MLTEQVDGVIADGGHGPAAGWAAAVAPNSAMAKCATSDVLGECIEPSFRILVAAAPGFIPTIEHDRTRVALPTQPEHLIHRRNTAAVLVPAYMRTGRGGRVAIELRGLSDTTIAGTQC
jgi:hypothetical protein